MVSASKRSESTPQTTLPLGLAQRIGGGGWNFGLWLQNNMGPVDLKSQMLQPYVLECKKWDWLYVKFVKRLLNVML